MRMISDEELTSKLAYAVLDANPLAILVANGQREVVWVNEAFTAHMGYSDEEVIGKDFLEVCLGEKYCELSAGIVEDLEKCERWQGEFNRKRKDGTEFYLRLNVAAMKMEGGEVCNYASSFTDILDKKLEERENRELRQRLSKAFDGSTVAQMIATLEDGRIFQANSSFLEFFGFSKDEVTGKTTRELGLINDETRSRAVMRLKDEGKLKDFEIVWKNPGGEKLWILWSAQQFEMGRQFFLHSTFTNVTETRLMEIELRKSEEKYRNLIEHQGEGVVITDLEEKFIFANPSADEIFGVGEGQLEGRSLYDFVSDSERGKINERKQKISQCEKSTHEAEITQPGGKKVNVLITLTPQYDEDGKVIGSFAIFRDITARKLAEEKMKNFKEALDSSSDAIGMSTPEGKHIYQNGAFDRILGEVGDDPPATCYVDQEVGREVFHTIMNGREWTGEVLMYGKDGNILNIFLRAYPVKREERIIALVGIHTDITARKLVEDALKDREQRLELALKGGGLGTWDWNVTTDEVKFDRRWTEMKGYRIDEIESHLSSWKKLVHPDDISGALEKLNAHLEGKTPYYEATFRMKHKSGEWRWIMDRGEIIERDENGKPLRACGTNLDVTEQKKAYESLKMAEIERTAILDAQPNHVVLQSPDLRVQWANRAACSSAGLSRRELIGRYCYEIWAQRRDPCPDCPVTRAMEYGETVTIEKETPGGKFWRITGAPILNDRDEVIMAVEITEDITEKRFSQQRRRQAEEKLRASERKYRKILEDIQDVYYRTDINNRLIMASPSAVAVFGYDSLEDMYGLDIASVFWADPAQEERFVEELKREGKITNYEIVLKKSDGSELTFLTSSHYYYDRDGNLLGVEGLLFDISERKEAEEKLEKMNKKLKTRSQALARANKQKERIVKRLKNTKDTLRHLLVRNTRLLNSMNQALIGIDRDGAVFQWNRRAEDLFGIPAPDAIGKKLSRCDIEWEWEKVNRFLDEARSEEKHLNVESVSYLRADGVEGVIDMEFSPMVEGKGDCSEYLILATDTTERRIIEMQLHQAQKLESIGQLAAGIAHEINTPMQYIGDNTRFMGDAFDDLSKLVERLRSMVSQYSGDEEKRPWMEKIEEAMEEADVEFLLDEVPSALGQSFEGIERVSKIVKSMKEFSHPGSKDKTLVDINKALDTTISISRNEWKYVAKMETDLNSQLPEVFCLQDEVNQVFLNLIINAAHAIEEKVGDGSEGKGVIKVSTSLEDGCVVVRVADTGTGISKEIQDRIFDPFYTTKEVGKGSGQGLAIAYSIIVDKHGGNLTFDTKLGEGSEFTVKLPLDSGGE
jgi:PAS domain S-box-containing protein